eukprot:2229691-Rhodomonas_salina.2
MSCMLWFVLVLCRQAMSPTAVGSMHRCAMPQTLTQPAPLPVERGRGLCMPQCDVPHADVGCAAPGEDHVKAGPDPRRSAQVPHIPW